jgi:hypothetical protein
MIAEYVWAARRLAVVLELSIEGDGATGELARLYKWLGHEPDLGPLVRYRGGIPTPGTLGPQEILVAAVSSGGVLSVLVASLKGFFALPRRSDIRLVVTRASGTRIEFEAKQVSDPETLVRELTRLIEDGE